MIAITAVIGYCGDCDLPETKNIRLLSLFKN